MVVETQCHFANVLDSRQCSLSSTFAGKRKGWRPLLVEVDTSSLRLIAVCVAFSVAFFGAKGTLPVAETIKGS
jgi:hypothetical protein